MQTKNVALAVAVAALGLAFWACGGTAVVLDANDASAEADAPSDSTTTDAPIEAASGDAAACVKAQVGDACRPNERACSGVDACCVGFVVTCDAVSGTWKKFGVGCPCQQISCGNRTCPGTQFCRVRSPGIRFPDGAVPDDTYECADFPDACKEDWTCGCLTAQPSSPTCLSNPAGAPCTMENGRPLQRCMGQ
jgi:hypothetical protein